MSDDRPLAEKLRPTTLEECVGQDHVRGKGQILSSFIEEQRLASMILWGPPGSGKTTLSRILVSQLDYPATEVSATIAGIPEIRSVLKKSASIKDRFGKPLVLFVDEIHHFNKHSQDAFLPYMERGDIVLIGTTIENPAYKINRALLSRLKIIELKPLGDNHLEIILDRALAFLENKSGRKLSFSEGARFQVIAYAAGDARRLLNILEIVSTLKPQGGTVQEAELLEMVQQKGVGYDRGGDDRYQLISAFHKSVRNSDCDAALFWLYRMIDQGEDPLYLLRRMVRIAAEDIGFADPEALRICLEAKAAYEFLGSPEGDLFLVKAAIYLSLAPKSNALYQTEGILKKLVEKYPRVSVPLHLINPDNVVAKKKGAGRGYLYAHDYNERTTAMSTLPEEIMERNFFTPGEIGFEKKLRERLRYWKSLKESMAGKNNNRS